jgi:hypothetical protein
LLLEHERTIVGSDYPELGTPSGIFHGHNGHITAIACVFGHLGWRAHTLYESQRLLYRVSIYDEHGKRLALFDDLRFPINDISIHPTRPLVALACGRYDGGMFFEGELLVYDWEKGIVCSVLERSREVTRCRFSETGDELAILLHPTDDYQFDWDWEKATGTFYGLTVSVDELFHAQSKPRQPDLDTLLPTDPACIGFTTGVLTQEDPSTQVAAWASEHNRNFTERHHVWDLTWLPGDRIAHLHSGCLVEIVDSISTQSVAWPIPTHDDILQGYHHLQRVQLHYLADELLVNVVGEARDDWRQHRSFLYHVSLLEGAKERNEFNPEHTFSWNADGYCLARNTDTGMNHPTDTAFLIDPHGMAMPLAVGHFDGANHYLRFDGGQMLYFLQGTPPESHAGKFLCKLDPARGIWLRVCPVDGRIPADGHAMHLGGCLISDDKAILSWIVHNYNPRAEKQGYVVCVNLHSGRFRWQQSMNVQVAASAFISAANTVVCASVDGYLSFFDVNSGELLHSVKMVVDGVPTLPLSLAINGNRVAVGTMDGRVVIYRIPKRP